MNVLATTKAKSEELSATTVTDVNGIYVTFYKDEIRCHSTCFMPCRLGRSSAVLLLGQASASHWSWEERVLLWFLIQLTLTALWRELWMPFGSTKDRWVGVRVKYVERREVWYIRGSLEVDENGRSEKGRR